MDTSVASVGPGTASRIPAMTFANVFVLLVALLGVGVFAYISYRLKAARIAAWAEFASRHGMQASGLHIHGAYEGHRLELDTVRRRSGKNSYTVTVLKLSVQESLPGNFTLSLEGLGDKVLKLLGHRDGEIGDEAFDQQFDLGNLSPETAQVLRHPSVKSHLSEVASYYRTFRIDGGWIHAEQRGTPSTADALEEFTGPALLLAHTLEQAAQRTRGRTRA